MLESILEILQQNPNGLSEYQLLQILREQRLQPFASSDLQNPLSLFQTHFLLFNQLYRLRDKLHQQQQYSLEIHSLNIRLLPWVPGSQDLALSDPLRDYYLDSSQLESTDAARVEEMLATSRLRLLRQDEAVQALTVLGFTDLLTTPPARSIRSHYRQLAALHHPDRGGDIEQAQAINRAYALLKELGYLNNL